MKSLTFYSVLGLIAALGIGPATAQTLTPLTVSGYTQDFVSGPTDPVGSGDGVSYKFVNVAWFGAEGWAANTPGGFFPYSTFGLPDNGTIVSESNPNATFQLASYTGNNAALVGSSNAGFTNNQTLTVTPEQYSTIGILYADQNANGAESLILDYSDNTTSGILTYSTNGQDWAGRDGSNNPQSPPANAALSGGDWVITSFGGHYGGLLEEADFAVDPTKTLTGITFSSTGSEFIMGISGDEVTVPEPGTWPLLLGSLGLLFGALKLRRRA